MTTNLTFGLKVIDFVLTGFALMLLTLHALMMMFEVNAQNIGAFFKSLAIFGIVWLLTEYLLEPWSDSVNKSLY